MCVWECVCVLLLGRHRAWITNDIQNRIRLLNTNHTHALWGVYSFWTVVKSECPNISPPWISVPFFNESWTPNLALWAVTRWTHLARYIVNSEAPPTIVFDIRLLNNATVCTPYNTIYISSPASSTLYDIVQVHARQAERTDPDDDCVSVSRDPTAPWNIRFERMQADTSLNLGPSAHPCCHTHCQRHGHGDGDY